MKLTPVAKTIARAAKEHGFLMMDRTGWGGTIGVGVENGLTFPTNPYPELFEGMWDATVMNGRPERGEVAFPFERLQVVRRDTVPGTTTPGDPGTPKPTPNPGGKVVVTDRSESTFGFEYAPMPAGATMDISWTRNGQVQTTTSHNGRFWSGPQEGYSDAQAVVRDASGKEIARSEVARPGGSSSAYSLQIRPGPDAFGVEASALPAGGSMNISWRRDGGQLQTTTVHTASFWSGPQAGYGEVRATLHDASGREVASAGPVGRG